MKTALVAGVSVGISLIVQQISKWIHAQEEARQKAIELTNSYKEQKASLDSQIEKYKELKETLDNGNLSTDETRSIKEQLLEIQKSLIESYGDEASNIDLVNGKYREQLGLLGELSKEKADKYVIEHRDDFEEAKEALEKIKKYDFGVVARWEGYEPTSENQKKLIEYLKTYSDSNDLIKFTVSQIQQRGYLLSSANLSVKADVESADEIMHQFAEDLEKFGKDNNIDVSGLLKGISGQLKKTWTDELTDYKTIYDEFMKAEVVRNDTLRPLYQQSIQAVEDYNNALSSGEGVEEAKANLDAVQQSVQNATGELEGSQEIFDGIYDGINKSAESAYNLGQAFENDESVKGYAEQLKGLADIDLKAINFEDNVQSPGEEAFKALIEILGLSEDEVQNLIDKLVEFGYIQGEVQSAPPGENLIFTGFTEEQSKAIDDFQSKMQTLSTALSALRSGEDVGMTELLEQFPELAGQSENLEDAIITLIYDSLDKLYGVLGEGLPDEARQDLQYLADTASGVAPDLNTAFASIQKSYDAMHEFKDAMDTGGLTEAILSNVGLLSPYMNQLVAQFHSGTISADELYQALTEHYHTDLANYGNALIAKNLMSEEFYNAVGLTNDEVINSFFNNYGVDIRNCKNYNQAKLAIEQQTLNTLGDMWKQYYNVQADAYTDDLAKLGDMAAHGDQEAQKKIVELQKQVDAYRKAMEALDNITYEGIEEDFDKITSGLNNKSSSSIQKETEEIFDFIAVKIENLEKQISRLEETASDASKSLKKRQQAYTDALSATTSEIGLQQQAYQKYMEKANSFGLSEEWAQKVRDGSLDISSVTDDALKQQIKSYQEWYKKALECSDSLDGLKKKLRELETARIQLEIDVKSNDLDKLESLYDKIENRISLSELFGGKASSSKYEALNKNLQKQIINLNEQNDLIAKQAEIVTKGSEAWQEYQKSINDNESSIRKLMQTIADNAETMAELTNEKTSDRIAGYDSRDDYYSAKADNATGYKTKNRYLNKEAANIQKRLDAYKNADTENKKALNSAASDITKFKKNSSNRDLLKEAKKYTKSKKEIPASLLEKAAALKDGGALYTAFVNYNAALAAYETGQQTRKLYEETAKKEKASLALEKFKNIESYYDNKQYRYSEKEEDIETEKSMMEAEGRTESTKYYKRLASNEEKRIASLKEQRKKLTSSLEKAVADGTIKKGSDEWYEMKRAIDDVTDAIDKSNLSLKEYENTIRQIKWDRFDTLQSKISNLISEMDFVIKELSRSSLTSSDTGSFTKEGQAVSALRASKYTAYIAQAKYYKQEIKKLNESIAKDPYDQELIKRKEELYSACQQTISAAQDKKDAIIDLYKDGYDALLSRVGELVSEYKEFHTFQQEKLLNVRFARCRGLL